MPVLPIAGLPLIAACLVAACLLTACAAPSEPERPATATSSTVVTRAQPSEATRLKALEGTPGSTTALPHGVAVPPPAYGTLPGEPGPSPATGPDDALVQIVLFTDFQCPVCRRVVEPVKLLTRRFPDDVRLVVKHAASPLHRRAEDAAAASLAALRQGAFWAFHDRAFVDQRRLARTDLLAVAAEVGLDAAQLAHDMDTESVRAQVRYETALAGELGLTATPTFVVNGYVQRGWGSYRGLEAIVERELERARALLADGVARTEVARRAMRESDPERGPVLATALLGPAD